MFNEFKKFILRGNIIDLLIGFTVGAAFSTVAKSLVDDIVMPPISAIMGNRALADKYFVLRSGSEAPPYETLEIAKNAGAITLNYGNFFNNVLSLLLVGFSMFLLIKFINRLDDHLDDIIGKKDETDNTPSIKKCPFCYSKIPYKATRCPSCTSKLEVKN